MHSKKDPCQFPRIIVIRPDSGQLSIPHSRSLSLLESLVPAEILSTIAPQWLSRKGLSPRLFKAGLHSLFPKSTTLTAEPSQII
jgi:hypothetical protein